MKKSLVLLSILICMSCNLLQKKDTTTITSIVDNIEKIVNKHDQNVQSSIDSKRFNYINTVSSMAMDSVRIKLNELIIMEIPANQEKLRETAIDYIESLQNVINSQKAYSLLTDSSTLAEAKEMDAKNMKMIESAKLEHEKYIKELNSKK